MDLGRESLNLLAHTYRDKSLDTFIRGLKGKMSIHLGRKEPTDFPHLLQLCLKMENQFTRAQFTNSHNHGVKINRQHYQPPTQIPPMAHYSGNNRPSFYPQLAFMPQPSTNIKQFNPVAPMYLRNSSNQFVQPQFYQNRNFQPPRPVAPKPQPRLEPMEIDPSMQSRAVNYMNRPAPNNRFVCQKTYRSVRLSA